MIAEIAGSKPAQTLSKFAGSWFEDLVQKAVFKAARKRLLPGEQLIEHRPHGKHVAPTIDRLSSDLLRGHVVQRSDQEAGLREASVGHRSRDPEVQNLEHLIAVDHQIGRFDITVNHATRVRVREAFAEAFDELQLTHRRHRSVAADYLTERLPVDVLHRDEGQALVFSDVEDGNDVAVSQIGGRSRFSREACPQVFVVRLSEQLDGNLSLEVRVDCEIYRAHPAARDEFADQVSTDCGGQFFHADWLGAPIILTLRRG